MQKLSITTPEEMFVLGQELTQSYKVLFLEWELGAGKTTLIKWFAAWLGIDPQRVNSPTYTYIQDYDNKLLHIDMYNIDSFDQLVDKWIAELIHEYEYIVIERPKFIYELGLDGLTVYIEKIKEDERIVRINNKL
jgi:tRNA threonylcarbamoyladenosine biosynthesis protein TsaE